MQPVNRMSAFALRMHSSTLLRQLVFLAAALASILIIGYHFGSFDQSIHIPFLKANANPSLYPGDGFVALRKVQPSFFWDFFLPFYRHGILEPALFFVHLLATYLTFWALWDLSLTLFESPLTALLSLLAFIMPHLGFVGFPVIEFSLLNRTFVLPFLLWAFTLYLRGKIPWAFLLIGLMFNLHLLSAVFALGILTFDALLRLRQVQARQLLAGLAAFGLAALPLLVWFSRHPQPIDLSLRPEWLSIVGRSVVAQIHYLIAPVPYILLITLNGLSGAVLLQIARRRAPSPLHDRTLVNFNLACLVAMASALVASAWLPVTLILQLQALRVAIFITIFSYLNFAYYLVKSWRSGGLESGVGLLLGVAFLTFTLPLCLLLVWLTLRFTPTPKGKRLAAGLTLLALTIFTFSFVIYYHLWYPGIHVYPPWTPWLRVQDWARRNTPPEAVFITPPQEFGLYTPDWRVFSERASVASLAELLEVALLPGYLPTWQERFSALAPGAQEQFAGNFFENQGITRQAFYSLSTSDLLRIACRYKADFLVTANDQPRPLPRLYANSGYTVYDLHEAKPCP